MQETTAENHKKIVKLAVRTLVEQYYISGSLGAEFSSTDRAVEGTIGHRKVQKSRPEDYEAEVQIVHRIDTPYFLLELNGRIDGVFTDAEPVIIEELKTTNQDPDMLADMDNPLHWGQLKVYAYCYAVENGLDAVTGQVTYYHLPSGLVHEIPRTFTLEELTAYFNELLSSYLAWANTVEEWRQTRDASIRETGFPFSDYRAGQRQMAVDVYLALKQQEQALIQAPTGIGKTAASLFPALKALGEGHVEKIFYMTARNTGKIAAEDALARLREQGLRVKSVTITAKEKTCFVSDIYCQPENCEYAKGYFDRVGGAISEGFAIDGLTRDTIAEIAQRHHICPFELSLDLSIWADCIICDYNYAFDPRVYLKRFFRDSNGEYAFLIDEAHNLVDRARDMFSAAICKRDVMDVRKAIKTDLPKLYRQLGRVNRWMNQARKQCREEDKPFAEIDSPETLLPLLQKFIDEAEKWLILNIPAVFRKSLLDLYFDANRFLAVAEIYDDCYATCYDHTVGELQVKLFCIDPSVRMSEALERSVSAVFFSATLTPMDYFRKLFGCGEDARQRILPSPFPPENLRLLLMPGISTKYRNREETIAEVAEMIIETVQHRQGNYLLFFPSYRYMQMVYDEFTEQEPDIETIVQTTAMTDDEREEFLDCFSSDNSETMVGFAVMGGIFGEGIDLVGDRLTGAVIVGVGLPGIGLERNLIRDYFNDSDNNGFEYAYMYPGLTRVLQAAGRVIRTEDDRGVVALIDERFAETRYRNLFPKEWCPVNIITTDKLKDTLTQFWGE